MKFENESRHSLSLIILVRDLSYLTAIITKSIKIKDKVKDINYHAK